MWAFRRKISLLLEHGHPEARDYPAGMVTDEVELIVDRINQSTVTNTVLMQLAVGSILSKEAGAALSKVIKGLQDGQ